MLNKYVSNVQKHVHQKFRVNPLLTESLELPEKQKGFLKLKILNYKHVFVFFCKILIKIAMQVF